MGDEKQKITYRRDTSKPDAVPMRLVEVDGREVWAPDGELPPAINPVTGIPNPPLPPADSAITIYPEVLNPPKRSKPGDPGHVTVRQHMSEKQEKYAQARLAGMTPAEAKHVAGYPSCVGSGQIEKSKAVQSAMDKALAKQGLTLDYLAENIRTSIDGCNTAKSITDKEGNVIAQDPDYASKAKFLTMLAKLHGYDKLDPAAAAGSVTQIYNDNRSFEGLANGEVAGIVDLLREELGRRQSGSVLPDNPKP